MFPSQFADGDSLDDWVRFIEKYPDRIMIGTDVVGHWEKYPAEVFKYYSILDRLSPATARKLGYENFLSLIDR